MSAADGWKQLLSALADLWEGEDRDGARALAAAFRNAAEAPPDIARAASCHLDAEIDAALTGAAHPVARALAKARPILPWRRTSIPDGRVTPDISDLFAVLPLAGPGLPVASDTVRGGLFAMAPGAFYPLHAHEAEETYAPIAGIAEWTVEGGRPETRGPGAYIHHPARAGHATRTAKTPVIAAWRWSGDIRLETYRLLETST